MNLVFRVPKRYFRPESRGLRNRLRRFQNRHPETFRAAKLAAGSGVGFFDTEVTLIVGSFLLYGKPDAPSNPSYSPIFLILNIIAFLVGVSVAFFVSDSLILGENREEINLRRSLARLGKFQLIFLVGNLAMVAVELLLLRALFPPVLGTIVGAIASFPLSYFFQWALYGNQATID